MSDDTRPRQRAHHLVAVGEHVHDARTGDRLDAAHAGGDTRLGDDLEPANLRGVAHVRAPAQLHGHAGNVHDAHHVAVLLAEHRRGALCLGLGDGHLARVQRDGVPDPAVDESLDLSQLVARGRSRCVEVEP
jgi:hypothetical protein